MLVRFKSSLLAVVLVVAAACTDGTNPGDNGGGPRPPGELHILALAQGSPLPATDSVGFWAVFDDDREVRIDLANGQDYLKFRVRPGALFKRPDGTLFGPGDSVFITLKIRNPDSLAFDFTPQGLKFNPAQPAELSLDYTQAGYTVAGDYDGDGDSDSADDAIEGDFDVWRQELPGDPFESLSAFLSVEIDEINVDITGFSRFALAY